jgi:NADH:ubiquinone oxidoreductase subunit B-like Fe-S oxidoreductase
VPGCPPRPEALFYAIDKLRDKVKAEEKLGVRE